MSNSLESLRLNALLITTSCFVKIWKLWSHTWLASKLHIISIKKLQPHACKLSLLGSDNVERVRGRWKMWDLPYKTHNFQYQSLLARLSLTTYLRGYRHDVKLFHRRRNSFCWSAVGLTFFMARGRCDMLTNVLQTFLMSAVFYGLWIPSFILWEFLIICRLIVGTSGDVHSVFVGECMMSVCDTGNAMWTREYANNIHIIIQQLKYKNTAWQNVDVR